MTWACMPKLCKSQLSRVAQRPLLWPGATRAPPIAVLTINIGVVMPVMTPCAGSGLTTKIDLEPVLTEPRTRDSPDSKLPNQLNEEHTTSYIIHRVIIYDEANHRHCTLEAY
ncbi:hypothetical protein EVAR_30018_1 [Eumeta japonica]|uniref:Uncharacterized protein n=1 Tax=Eumeta variegata TaxID=151549 RepID=A0A4C1VX20_EUMVA|nr:hypothetical protein EVAR_30018_1 [Eumeta japonica]